jgi:DNA invertase Pin-like site-specific DNA recombinase
VALRILNLNIDTGTPTGKLMLNLLGAIAEFERGVMLERQREGIAKAKSAGKYKGRALRAQEHATLRSLIANLGNQERVILKTIKGNARNGIIWRMPRS